MNDPAHLSRAALNFFGAVRSRPKNSIPWRCVESCVVPFEPRGIVRHSLRLKSARDMGGIELAHIGRCSGVKRL
jgi:hypothetical protein